MSLSVLGVLAFFGAAVLALVALQDLALDRRAVFRTLRGVDTIEMTAADLRRRELALPFTMRVGLPALRRLAGLSRRFTPANVLQRLDRELVYAGSPANWDAERVMALKFLGTAIGPAAAIGFGRLGGLVGLQMFVLAGSAGLIGYYAPEWVLRSRSGKRQFLIRRALPDALDLLSITVEAGLAFDAAVARVARQSGGPLAAELHRVLQEMQIGKSRADALRDLGERTAVEELKSFVLSMIQADVFGISIAKVLQTQAHEMRVRRRQQAEERAQKLQVKIIFPLILCIFPSLFVVLLGPAMITIYRSIIAR
ncbi:MAG: type II secretion system F family protein [Actinomycetota bacterium]